MTQTAFEQLISHFPLQELPVLVGPESYRKYEAENQALPEILIQRFLLEDPSQPMDDYTEVVPCFRMIDENGIHALVFWKAELLEYKYFIATFDKTGQRIDRAVIAGIRVEGKHLKQTVCKIDSEWIISLIEGDASVETGDFDSSLSRLFSLEIMGNGQIVAS